MKKSMIGVILLIGLIVYGIYDSRSSQSAENSPSGSANSETGSIETGIQKGQLAPDFELTDLKGNSVKLSDYRGSTVIINFWATWCPPCKVEMPHMEKFHQNYEGQGVVVLAVNLATIEKNDQDVYRFAEEQQLSLPILLDEEGWLKERYRITAYPTTYFIDEQGIIRQKYPGAIDYEIIKKTVQQIN